VLILSHNQLTSIPAELFRPAAGLRVVDMSHNRLHSLPEALFNSGGMERLALAHNQLTDMPVPSLGPAAAASLCELDLSGNAIASLHSPDDFSRFKVTQRRHMHCGNQFGR
jgi:Leucine-rich repeat (LRR) protein